MSSLIQIGIGNIDNVFIVHWCLFRTSDVDFTRIISWEIETYLTVKAWIELHGLKQYDLDMQNWLFLLSNAVMDKMIIYVFYTFVEQYWLNDSKMDVNINSKMPYLVFHMKGYEGSYHCRNQRHGETLKKLHLIVIHCGFKLQ